MWQKFKKRIIDILIILILLLFLFSLFNIGKEYYSKYKSEQMAKELVTEVVSISTNNASEQKIIDFEKLKNINDDTVAWIDIPSVNIADPIVHTNNNTYYLTYNFNRQSFPITGANFLDMDNSPDFSDKILYIYGHNVEGSTAQFSNLHRFDDRSFLENNRDFSIFLPGNIEKKYQILGAALVPPVTPLYPEDIKDMSNYSTFINELRKYIPESEIQKIKPESQIVLLVTCKWGNDNSKRRIVFAISK